MKRSVPPAPGVSNTHHAGPGQNCVGPLVRSCHQRSERRRHGVGHDPVLSYSSSSKGVICGPAGASCREFRERRGV